MKMKYTKKIISLILTLVCLVCTMIGGPVANANQNSNNDKRACWISFLDMEEYLLDLSEDEFRTKITQMYDNIISYGMNTVIVHTRAMGDAMYPSEYFPLSIYLDSDRSMAYDPMQIMVELAHEKMLYFEAWINPYRLSKNEATTVSYKESPYYDMYKEFTMEYENTSGETCLSLDPSKIETNELICSQVKEIIEKYDVDGIHFDDYFYMPGMADAMDESTKMQYVNAMVKQVYDTVKSVDCNVTFGISPAGNTSSARSQGADIDTWLSTPGYIDYIMPQIYWSDSYMMNGVITTLYSDRCNEWKSLNLIDIPMYSGLALYRVGEESETDLGWKENHNNLKNQYEVAYNLGYDGYALFRYAWLEYEDSKTELTNLYAFSATLPDGGIYENEVVESDNIDVMETEITTAMESEQIDDESFQEEIRIFGVDVSGLNKFYVLQLAAGDYKFWNLMSFSSYCNLVKSQKTLKFY